MNSKAYDKKEKDDTIDELQLGTRQRLLNNAIRLIKKDGINGLSMNKVAKMTGIAQPSFYNHFKNLHELLEELRAQIRQHYFLPLKESAREMVESKDESHDVKQRLFVEMLFRESLKERIIFQRILADRQQVGGPNAGQIGCLFDEIIEEWIIYLEQAAKNNNSNVSRSQICLCVDTITALVSELIVGVSEERYTEQEAIDLLISLSSTLLEFSGI